MGFANVASMLILLIAALSITTGVVLSLKDYYDKTTSAVTLEQTRLSEQLKTDITIEVVDFDNLTNTTYAYVKNSGAQRLDVAKVDIYLDDVRIPRNETNRTIAVIPDTEVLNNETWDTKEVALITVFNFTLASNVIHEVSVTTQYGVKDTLEFSI
ncbi:hypothetical protein C4573_00040 [Candidatus Woesearchaeota archaeon]|nr:MAG: hypothetical protein C4573_00040 [Candidatus Woesearchaeota archaeon]